MKKKVLIVATLTSIAGIYGPPAMAAGVLVRFDGGIGEDPVAGIDTSTTPPSPVRNDVEGVTPGGRTWVIKDLDAKVMKDGHIRVTGKGLLLAATNAVGTAGGVTQVGATLYCGGAPYSVGPVPLDQDGDFQINGMLDSTPPNPCTTPVLLIRNDPGGVLGSWFAAGILKD
jgi:hypothetical protein